MMIIGKLYDSYSKKGSWEDTTEISDALADKYRMLCDRSCVMTCEILHNLGEGKISLTIEDPDFGDYKVRIIDRDEQHPEKMTEVLEELIGSFDPAEHEQWRQECSGEAELPQDSADLDIDD